ncbi:1811_t:CDS:2 [Acaulospora morrowiae]|uniref:1811_t:CDS:1 n=1 Tax=Acaulospora morrowiae TaxID=94023 RepID=A0A9N9EN23_9GLOM|nr:1811_t:CDS:2 [Acaulospora morrowiae]
MTEIQNLSSQAKTLKKLAYQSRKGISAVILPTREQLSTPSICRSEPTHIQMKNKKKQSLLNEENGNQNLITQVQDIRYKVEVNENTGKQR